MPRKGSVETAKLREVLREQQGYFTTVQAREAGISPQLLRYHCRVGRFERVRHGIYRATEYPPGERSDLILPWLWSGKLGVFSHSTALSLHELSELLPDRLHMTLPLSERGRQRQTLPGLVLHYAEIDDDDRSWYESVPITSVRRTLLDCVADQMNPALLREALGQAVERALLDVDDITAVVAGIEKLEGAA
jgi:predicted transcriptional regulator of viral defense system